MVWFREKSGVYVCQCQKPSDNLLIKKIVNTEPFVDRTQPFIYGKLRSNVTAIKGIIDNAFSDWRIAYI